MSLGENDGACIPSVFLQEVLLILQILLLVPHCGEGSDRVVGHGTVLVGREVLIVSGCTSVPSVMLLGGGQCPILALGRSRDHIVARPSHDNAGRSTGVRHMAKGLLVALGVGRKLVWVKLPSMVPNPPSLLDYLASDSTF